MTAANRRQLASTDAVKENMAPRRQREPKVRKGQDWRREEGEDTPSGMGAGVKQICEGEEVNGHGSQKSWWCTHQGVRVALN